MAANDAIQAVMTLDKPEEYWDSRRRRNVEQSLRPDMKEQGACDLSYLLLADAGPCKMRSGWLDKDGHECLLFSFSGCDGRLPSDASLARGKGFRLSRPNANVVAKCFQDDKQGSAYLQFSREPSGDYEIFTCLANQLIDRAKSHAQQAPQLQLRAVLDLIDAWQSFINRGGDRLSDSAELGLFGEINAIIAMIEAGGDPKKIIKAWSGPKKALHDFEFDLGSLEVKTTSDALKFHVHANGMDQFDPRSCQTLHLLACQAKKSAKGSTLPEIIGLANKKLSGDLASQSKFHDLLCVAGYCALHEKYYDRKFQIERALIHHVDESFPKITSALCMPGIIAANYSVDIDSISAKPIAMTQSLATLGAI